MLSSVATSSAMVALAIDCQGVHDRLLIGLASAPPESQFQRPQGRRASDASSAAWLSSPAALQETAAERELARQVSGRGVACRMCGMTAKVRPTLEAPASRGPMQQGMGRVSAAVRRAFQSSWVRLLLRRREWRRPSVDTAASGRGQPGLVRIFRQMRTTCGASGPTQTRGAFCVNPYRNTSISAADLR